MTMIVWRRSPRIPVWAAKKVVLDFRRSGRGRQSSALGRLMAISDGTKQLQIAGYSIIDFRSHRCADHVGKRSKMRLISARAPSAGESIARRADQGQTAARTIVAAISGMAHMQPRIVMYSSLKITARNPIEKHTGAPVSAEKESVVAAVDAVVMISAADALLQGR